jgi:EAL domain-containing protein (putative c-di-GMP-specific phosphodiesterase class I)
MPTDEMIAPPPWAAARHAGPCRRGRHDAGQIGAERGFVLQFQPRVALEDASVRAMQAQLRWPRRRGGVSAPNALQPLLEEYGLTDSAEAWALRAACQAALGQDAPVALALCGDSLRHGTLLAHVGAALAETGLDAERLEITLPAPALADADDSTLLTLAALRDTGVAVGADAFAENSACLMTLMRLPLTVVKLDRRLVRDMPGDSDTAALAQATITFAHRLGMTVVATGVETQAQLTALHAAGCDQGQGSLCRGVEGEGQGALPPGPPLRTSP